MGAAIVGVAVTPFDKWPQRTLIDLAEEALSGVMSDAAIADGTGIDMVHFANCAMGAWGQNNIRGQVCLAPSLRRGVLAPYTPITNVEAGCATGSAAFVSAFHAVNSGQVDLALAIGVEKTWIPDDVARTFALFLDGIDQLEPDRWQRLYREAGERTGLGFEPHHQRVVFLDVHALAARQHMARYGSTVEQLARIASKSRAHGALNPKAQFRAEMSVSEVLDDKAIVAPLTRAMCAPVSDGAAAVLLASDRWLTHHPAHQERAVEVRASVLAGGRWRDLDDESVVDEAARRAYHAAGIEARQVQLAEVHDATTACEMLHMESLGFCEKGEGGEYASSGATQLGGERPINTSGGLISRGHPLGATGLAMIAEVTTQLRGEAGARQVEHATVGLVQNAGGMVSFDEALCGVTILAKS